MQASKHQQDYTERDAVRREVVDVLDYRRSRAEMMEAARGLREMEAQVAQVREALIQIYVAESALRIKCLLNQ